LTYVRPKKKQQALTFLKTKERKLTNQKDAEGINCAMLKSAAKINQLLQFERTASILRRPNYFHTH
jgi:hypothetical protein